MTSCALCVDAEATEQLERKGRAVRLCWSCTMAALKVELDSGCRIGEPHPGGPLKGRELTWSMVGRAPRVVYRGFEEVPARSARKPSLDELDRRGSKLDWSEESHRRQTR